MADCYKQLALHLDKLPGGYPATESGVELRILKRLFSEEEARIALELTMQPETVDAISERLGMDSDRMAPILSQMSQKGLIFRMIKKNQQLYMAAQFAIGIWEYHVNDLDEGLINDFNAYVPHLARQWTQHKTKQLRVVPISKSLSAEMEIMPYEAAEQIIQQQSKIVVAPCICRKEHRMVGKGCDNPLEVCLVFGTGAYFYEENGLGRDITQKEALEILQKGADAGLVLQPGNSQKAMNICMCCGCCCQVLKNLNAMEQPAKAVNSSYYAAVKEEACIGCGICVDRCHMQAITLDDVEEKAQIDLDRCIGCGACIPTCEVDAMELVAKSEDQRWVPPTSVFKTYFNIASERGLF